MAVGTGHKTTFGFGKESTWGTPVAATNWVEMVSETLNLEREPIVKESLRRVSQSNTFQGVKIVSGGVEAEVMYDGWLKLLENFLGSGATTIVEPAVRFSHAFTLSDTPPTGLTLHLGRPEQGFRYHGMKGNELTLSVEAGGLLRASMGFVGEDEEKFSVAAATFPTQRLIPFHQGAFTIQGSGFDVDAFSVTLNNAIKGDRQKLGSELVKEGVRDGIREITGEFSKDFETVDVAGIYDIFTGHTDRALKLDFTGPALGAGNYKFTVDLFRVKFGGVTPQVAGPGIVRITVPYRALFDESGAQDAFKVTVVNGEASI